MKRIIMFIAVLTMLFSACGNAETKISEKRAEEIALSNAGVSQDEVKYIRTEKDRDNGKTVYDIEFRTKDNREFDYEIDADTGDVLSYDKEVEGLGF